MPKGVYHRTKKFKKKLLLNFGSLIKGEKHYLWKGNKVSYRGIHHWVQRHLGKANHCEECGLKRKPKGMKRYFQWANVSKNYKRNLKDFKQMCVPCHKIYDKK